MRAERVVVGLACWLGAGCGGEDADVLEADVLEADVLQPGGLQPESEPGEARVALPAAVHAQPRPTLDEFAASVRQTLRSGDEELEAYVLEGDMLVPYELVVAYYEARYLGVQPKGVGVVISAAGPFIGPPNFLTRDMPVRYCYEERFSEDEREAIDQALSRAMNTWAAVANVSFERVFTLDGSGCTADAAGKDIRVFRFQDTIGQGSFPLEPNQIIGTPATPLANSTYLHEIGHVLGLAHEQFHSDSPCAQVVPQGLQSRFPATRNQNLSARMDQDSIMFQSDASGNIVCQGGGTQNVILSAGDGEAARRLYGN